MNKEHFATAPICGHSTQKIVNWPRVSSFLNGKDCSLVTWLLAWILVCWCLWEWWLRMPEFLRALQQLMLITPLVHVHRAGLGTATRLRGCWILLHDDVHIVPAGFLRLCQGKGGRARWLSWSRNRKYLIVVCCSVQIGGMLHWNNLVSNIWEMVNTGFLFLDSYKTWANCPYNELSFEFFYISQK